jgi:phospholipid/cholesterol/gamma-HCH transport system permease protein
MQFFTHLGGYYLLLLRTFTRPERYKIFFKRILEEIELIGLGSISIVSILSIFMGAVMLIQAANNFSSPWVPIYAEGVAARDSMILEFSPTIISMVLAGKVGSSIAGQIGTMKVTEQINAMEIMGVNPPNYLIFPKVIAAMFFFPFLVILSIFLGVSGGYIAALVTGLVTAENYIYGIQFDYNSFYVTYALVKSVFFAFLITTISSYQGYYTRGGAKEVGASSTKAVVYSCIAILFFDVILTQLMLTPGS